MKLIAVMLLILIIPSTAFALQNPIDYAGDTIRKNTNDAIDDAISDIKIAAHETKKEMIAGTKTFFKWLITQVMEIFTICAVGYAFTFLVPKSTGKKMLWVTGLCGINKFLMLFL